MIFPALRSDGVLGSAILPFFQGQSLGCPWIDQCPFGAVVVPFGAVVVPFGAVVVPFGAVVVPFEPVLARLGPLSTG